MVSKPIQKIILSSLPKGYENMTVQQVIEIQKQDRQKKQLDRMKVWRNNHKAERQSYFASWLANHPNYYKKYFQSERGKQVNREAQKRYKEKKKNSQ